MQELISKIPIPKIPPPAPKKKIVAEVVFEELDSKGRDKFLISQEQVVAKATWNFLKEVSMMKDLEEMEVKRDGFIYFLFLLAGGFRVSIK